MVKATRLCLHATIPFVADQFEGAPRRSLSGKGSKDAIGGFRNARSNAHFFWAASGHASTARPRLLSAPTVFLHAIGVAFWIGALILLMATLHGCVPAVTATLLRFSRAIPFVLVPIILSGVTLAIIQLDAHIEALWTITRQICQTF